MTAMVTGYKTREGMLSVNHTTARGECDANVVAANLRAHHAGNRRQCRQVHRHCFHCSYHPRNARCQLLAHLVRDWEADSNEPAGCGVKDIARQLIEVSPPCAAA